MLYLSNWRFYSHGGVFIVITGVFIVITWSFYSHHWSFPFRKRHKTLIINEIAILKTI